MARKQSPPRFTDSHLGRKAAQASANIAGKGRRTILTVNDVAAANNATYLDVVDKTFASAFFKTPGDAIYFTLSGQIGANAALLNALQIVIRDGDAGLLLSPGLCSFVAPADDVAIICNGHIYITEDKAIGCGFHFGSYNAGSAYQGFAQRSKGTNVNSTGKMRIQLQFLGEELELDFFSAEFAPAVIT